MGKGVATILTFKQILLSMDNKIRVLMGFVVYGQQIFNSVSDNYQVLSLTNFSLLIIRHLSVICPMIHPTTKGQQSDNEQTRANDSTDLFTTITFVNNIQNYTFLGALDSFEVQVDVMIDFDGI